MPEICRCEWANPKNNAYILYHDTEWGVPVYDDRVLFEFVVLESAQAGLSWETVLNKRQAYKLAFDDFDWEKIAQYGPEKVENLMGNAGIIRNRAKIMGTIANAQAFMRVREEFGSFSKYIWGFIGYKPIKNAWEMRQQVPASTPLSDEISKDMKKRGFKFFGTTVCYAHLQATGMVNDHLTSCFRYNEV